VVGSVRGLRCVPVGTGNRSKEPLYTIRNTATRWLTLTNYDLLVYEDVLVASVVSYGSHFEAAKIAAGSSRALTDRGLDDERVAAAARAGRNETAARVVIRADETAAARLSKRMGVVILRLELLHGRDWKFIWLNAERWADYSHARDALERMLGSKLHT
jgi:hypothetical protein